MGRRLGISNPIRGWAYSSAFVGRCQTFIFNRSGYNKLSTVAVLILGKSLRAQLRADRITMHGLSGECVMTFIRLQHHKCLDVSAGSAPQPRWSATGNTELAEADSP